MQVVSTPGYVQLRPTWTEVSGLHDPFLLGSIKLLEWLTELKETLTFSSLLKDVIKDTDEQLDEELHRERSRSIPSARASVPLKLGCITLPFHGCVLQTGSLPDPVLLGVLWRLHHIGMMVSH